MLKIIVQVNDVGVDRHLQQRHGNVRLGIFFSFTSNFKFTLFSHSNSAHICRNSASVQEAGWM